MSETLRVGTRASPLARAQTEEVLTRLQVSHPSLEVEVVPIRTHGDDGYSADLGTSLDGKRMFTKRIEDALLDGRIDFAVHSLKDLPTELVEGVTIAAIPPRADPRDILVASDVLSGERLLPGTRLGTSSLRRKAQLLARWPDVEVVELHGNVDTRLRLLDARDVDAIVIAAAGFARLNVRGRTIELLSPDVITPAPGQGALAVEARSEDDRVCPILAAIDDPMTRRTTEIERALSVRIGGGCNAPLGALATLDGSFMVLRAVVASADGRRLVRAFAQRPMDDSKIVEKVARELLERGALDILREAT